MATTDSRTANRNLPKPHIDNTISEDFARLIDALDLVDTDLNQLFTGLGTKAPIAHGHEISHISGLQAALDAASSSGGGAESLNELTDVSTNGVTNFQVLAFISGSWQPWAVQAQYVSGLQTMLDAKSDDGHGHTASEITGLEDAMSGKANKSGDSFTGKVNITVNTTSPTYATGQMELRSTDGSDVSLGFHRSGDTAAQLRHESNGLILSGSSRTAAANFTATGEITAFSDARIKTDVETIEGALSLILRMRGVRYTRIDSGARGTGVIAQEIQEVMPEVVLEGEMLSVAYGNLVGVLIEAVKELTARVEELEAR